mgnify:CR=1 FL=1
MKQEYNIDWKLQNKIVDRQLAVRREDAYGFSLLQELIGQCGGSLTRVALPEG